MNVATNTRGKRKTPCSYGKIRIKSTQTSFEGQFAKSEFSSLRVGEAKPIFEGMETAVGSLLIPVRTLAIEIYRFCRHSTSAITDETIYSADVVILHTYVILKQDNCVIIH
jgi:hypothetical protein